MTRFLSGLTLAIALVGGTGCAQTCPAALLTGALEEQGGELVVNPDGGGGSERIVWPSGHNVGRDRETLVVTNLFGQVVAREGDRVRLGGGARESGTWVVCGLFAVEPRSP